MRSELILPKKGVSAIDFKSRTQPMTFDTTNALCARCGKEFPREELMQMGDALLCAQCKPAHLEHLRRSHAEKTGQRFLFTGVNPEGARVTDYVEAANLGAAKYTLEMRGYRDLVFHEDDISSAASRLFDQPKEDPRLEGEEMLKMVRKNSEFYNFWVYLKQNPVLKLLMLAVIVVAIYRGNPLHWSAIVGYVYFFIVLAFYVFATIPVMRYNRLASAVEWGRWDSVQDLVDKLRKSNRYSLARIPAFELDMRAAQVLAAKGRLDEGLALLKKYEEDPTVEPFLYHSRLSAVYSTAHDYDNYMAETLRSAELAPTSGSVQVDVALAYILRKGDSASAQEYLDKAREMTLPDLATLWIHMIQGMIHLKEDRPQAAEEELVHSQTIIESLKNVPFMESCGYLVKTKRALAAAAMGKMEQAKVLFAEVKPWLESANEAELLAECQGAIKAGQEVL